MGGIHPRRPSNAAIGAIKYPNLMAGWAGGRKFSFLQKITRVKYVTRQHSKKERETIELRSKGMAMEIGMVQERVSERASGVQDSSARGSEFSSSGISNGKDGMKDQSPYTIRRWCGIFVALRASGRKNDDLGRRVRRRRALSLALGAGAMGKVERRLRGWETEEPEARASNPAPRTTPPAHEHLIVHLRVSLICLVESPPLTRLSHTRNRRRPPPVAEQARRTVRSRKREGVARMVHDVHGAICGWIWIRTSTVVRERRVCRDRRAPRRAIRRRAGMAVKMKKEETRRAGDEVCRESANGGGGESELSAAETTSRNSASEKGWRCAGEGVKENNEWFIVTAKSQRRGESMPDENDMHLLPTSNARHIVLL
ncbi:hypothetical protein B0H14DRAFT_3165121 [Mycena olivaceomarginata]|nr:hypothetical protein B0H14DRAFT_3165121 [Mycena olivaceomarginata]